jgi:hypothetical protein
LDLAPIGACYHHSNLVLIVIGRTIVA